MKVSFKILLEQYCLRRARVATFERLLTLSMEQKTMQCHLHERDFSWTNNIQNIIVMYIVGTNNDKILLRNHMILLSICSCCMKIHVTK